MGILCVCYLCAATATQSLRILAYTLYSTSLCRMTTTPLSRLGMWCSLRLSQVAIDCRVSSSAETSAKG